MSDLKLFQTRGGALAELQSASAPLERALQTLFERNLDALLGVRFLASEYVTTTADAWTPWASTRTATR